MSWSNEAVVERLKVLWKDGLSASQISKALAREFLGVNVSRNAVIGKVYRLGLSGRERPSAPPRVPSRPKVYRPSAGTFTPRNPTENQLATMKANAQARAQPAPDVLARARAFVPLEGCPPVAFASPGCRWPVGGEGADMLCCGAPRIPSTHDRPNPPYCEAHTSAARGRAPRPRAETSRKVFHNIGNKKAWAA